MNSRAIANDAEWNKLTPEEQKEWMDALTEADRRWDAAKNNAYAPMNFRQSQMEYEYTHRIEHWE